MSDLGLYVHIPFCVRKCLYCDFLSAPGTPGEIREYVSSLTREIRSSLPRAEGRTVSTVFIGGGTPSLLTADELESIFDALFLTFEIEPDAEISMEMNPGTIREDFLRTARRYVNRVSVGVQSANDRELSGLGRIHTFREAEAAVRMLREAGFGNLNLDLMCGIPLQTKQSFSETLARTIALNPEHVSCYSLILEEGTPFMEAAERGSLSLPSEDAERRMICLAERMLAEAGYERYEFSNYAKCGFRCRHNIKYWRREEYLGFGVGAASFYDGSRWSNTPDCGIYRKYSGDPERIAENQVRVDTRGAMEEYMFLGLRMTDGVTDSGFRSSFGVPIRSVYGDILRKHEEGGFLVSDGGGNYRLTRRGEEVSNVILADYLFDTDDRV